MRSEEEEAQLDVQEAMDAPPGLADLVVRLVTPLYPTEDEHAVRRAISNLFPEVELNVAGPTVQGTGRGPAALARLRRRIREMRIRDTARSLLRGSAEEGRLRLSLNKQGALARVPNFSTGGAPLGDIDVTVETSDPTALVEWLCEPATD